MIYPSIASTNWCPFSEKKTEKQHVFQHPSFFAGKDDHIQPNVSFDCKEFKQSFNPFTASPQKPPNPGGVPHPVVLFDSA